MIIATDKSPRVFPRGERKKTMPYNIFQIFSSATTGIITFIFCILIIIAWWKVFEKASLPGWHSIVPFLNSYDSFKISWGYGWLFLLLFIPIVNVIIWIIMTVKMGNAFRKSTLFIVGLVFLPNVFYLILGFDSSSVYYGPSN